ncbi:unnamed protein product [Symbiodinium sp. CCMP2592]|nr:unnamed protein product [Symbiodinium sp. CCMP2592]
MADDRVERLSTRLESQPILRRRFRKGLDWIKTPPEALGDNTLLTTNALNLNFSSLRETIQWMSTPKISVKSLFKKMNHVPEEKRQPWIDAWSIRTMVSFALKRQRDSEENVRKLFKIIKRRRKEWARAASRNRLQEEEDEQEEESGEDENEPEEAEDDHEDKKGKGKGPAHGAADDKEQEEDSAGEGEGEEEEDVDAHDAIVELPGSGGSSSYGMQQKRDKLAEINAQIAELRKSLIGYLVSPSASMTALNPNDVLPFAVLAPSDPAQEPILMKRTPKYETSATLHGLSSAETLVLPGKPLDRVEPEVSEPIVTAQEQNALRALKRPAKRGPKGQGKGCKGKDGEKAEDVGEAVLRMCQQLYELLRMQVPWCQQIQQMLRIQVRIRRRQRVEMEKPVSWDAQGAGGAVEAASRAGIPATCIEESVDGHEPAAELALAELKVKAEQIRRGWSSQEDAALAAPVLPEVASTAPPAAGDEQQHANDEHEGCHDDLAAETEANQESTATATAATDADQESTATATAATDADPECTDSPAAATNADLECTRTAAAATNAVTRRPVATPARTPQQISRPISTDAQPRSQQLWEQEFPASPHAAPTPPSPDDDDDLLIMDVDPEARQQKHWCRGKLCNHSLHSHDVLTHIWSCYIRHRSNKCRSIPIYIYIYTCGRYNLLIIGCAGYNPVIVPTPDYNWVAEIGARISLEPLNPGPYNPHNPRE